MEFYALTDVDCEKLFDVSLIVALIALAFDSTYMDQDNLPVVTSGTSYVRKLEKTYIHIFLPFLALIPTYLLFFQPP